MTIDAKNIALLIGVMLLIGIFGLYVPYRMSPRAPAPAAATTGEHFTVLYTNKGFEPQSLTVPVGTTVEWINVSDKPLWVASDPHPAHTDLPGFDQQYIDTPSASSVGLIPVASAHTQTPAYFYTFKLAGHWKYHNHLIPTDRGTVIVN